MHRFRLTLCIFLGLLEAALGQPTPANDAVAPWKFAWWGMTVDDVLKAAAGTASYVPDHVVEGGPFIRFLYNNDLVVARWRAADTEFVAYLIFRTREAPFRLTQITLEPRQPRDCDRIRQYFATMFGPPVVTGVNHRNGIEFVVPDVGWLTFYVVDAAGTYCVATITPEPSNGAIEYAP